MNAPYQSVGKKWLAMFLLAPLLAILAACTSLPTDLQDRSDALKTQLKATSEAIEQQRKDFDSLLTQDEYAFMAAYTTEQQHKDRFDQASSKLATATTLFDEQVKPLIDGFDESERQQLETAFTNVEAVIGEATALAGDPAAWVVRVADTKRNTLSLIENGRTANNALVADYALLENEVLAASQRFPAQTDAIKEKVAPLEALRTSATASILDVDTEASQSQPNFADLATSLTTIQDSSTSYANGAKTLRTELTDLSATETRTLLDFRVDSFVEINRTSWNENLDFPTENEHDYPGVLVSTETATYFADRLNQLIGTVNPGFFSGNEFQLEGSIEQSRWDELGIDPKIDWPNGDNMAEFVVSGIEDTYCQKLKVLRSGEPDSSARPDPSSNPCAQYDIQSDILQGVFWEETDEFDAEAIGMDIYSKAYGDFDSQATTAATPPDMAYVGDPATGEWQEDSNGNSFWYYYGQYAFFNRLIGGPQPYHYRSEYDTWNRDYRRSNQPYYATSSGTPRYGADSPMVSSRFPESTFVKSGLSTATVRNAGPAARAGGPGNGGK